jgi:bifunctional DNA-binding transcriptional regulator/antitoxin component of YhaV-PrlF toxin-antitoxin module
MNKYNKQTLWISERKKLIVEAIASGRIIVRSLHSFPEGTCEDCKQWRQLDPDHRLKRSQGGSNEPSNIDWVCRKCHDKRDNRGDPMNKKEKKTKKADWELPHKCKNCGAIISFLICPHCKK